MSFLFSTSKFVKGICILDIEIESFKLSISKLLKLNSFPFFNIVILFILSFSYLAFITPEKVFSSDLFSIISCFFSVSNFISVMSLSQTLAFIFILSNNFRLSCFSISIEVIGISYDVVLNSKAFKISSGSLFLSIDIVFSLFVK